MRQVDAEVGLAMLLRNGTLPEVWILPSGLRDLRGLLRTRLGLRCHTRILKNRIHAALRRYGQYEPGEPKNLFVGKGRVQLAVYIGSLPQETRLATRHEWALVEEVEAHLKELEVRIRLGIGQLGWVRLLKTLPGVGDHCCPTKSRRESVGCSFRLIRSWSRMAGVPVKWALFRKASG